MIPNEWYLSFHLYCTWWYRRGAIREVKYRALMDVSALTFVLTKIYTSSNYSKLLWHDGF
jgi:hypothetical protein